MPSIAFGEARSGTSARVIHVPDDAADRIGPDPTRGAAIGSVAAALLAGETEIRTSAPDVARTVRAVIDRLLAARSAL